MGGSQKKRVLFIVEGEDTERELILAAMSAFGINTEGFAILLYRTNVHALIDAIAGEDGEFEDDFESVEMREVLAEMLESGAGSIGEVDYHGMVEHTAGDAEWLRTASITDVFLLFDFDPQANKYSPKRLRAFQAAFMDSTGDQGRLLLSYPMIEAYKDAGAHSYDDFRALDANRPLSEYKKVVNDRLCAMGKGEYCGLKAYDRETFARCIAFSIAKARFMTTSAGGPAGYNETPRGGLASQCDDIDLVSLLIEQQRLYEEDGTVAVVCTALFFLSVWPVQLDHAWSHCKSMGLV